MWVIYILNSFIRLFYLYMKTLHSMWADLQYNPNNLR